MNSNVCPIKLAKAKELYFQYHAVTKISEETGIKRSTIQYHVNQRWKQERQVAKQDLLSALLEGKEQSLTKITDYSIRAIERALRDVATRDENPSINEARNIVTILEKIDNIATREKENEQKNKEEDSQEKPTSLEEIKQKIANDPFSSF